MFVQISGLVQLSLYKIRHTFISRIKTKEYQEQFGVLKWCRHAVSPACLCMAISRLLPERFSFSFDHNDMAVDGGETLGHWYYTYDSYMIVY